MSMHTIYYYLRINAEVVVSEVKCAALLIAENNNYRSLTEWPLAVVLQ